MNRFYGSQDNLYDRNVDAYSLIICTPMDAIILS